MGYQQMFIPDKIALVLQTLIAVQSQNILYKQTLWKTISFMSTFLVAP